MYIHPKLVKGFQKLLSTDLKEDQVQFLSIVADHGDVPGTVYKLFFVGAFEVGSEDNTARWATIKMMNKEGFIDLHYIPRTTGSGNMIEKYDHHPDLREHLESKYAEILSPNADGFKHILSLGFEQSGATLFHKTFQPAKNVTLDSAHRYLFTVTMRRGQAILEVKQI